MKKVVVTCITNGCDTLKTPLVVSDEYEYICFTDRYKELRSDVWDIKPLPEHGKYIDRKIKMLTHKYVDYDLCLWVDGSIHITGDVSEFEKLIEEYEMLVQQHWVSHTVEDEFQECFRLNRGDVETLVQQRSVYATNGMLGLPTYAMGVFLKKKSPLVEAIMEEWWNEFNKFPGRDQVSFPMALKNSTFQSLVVAHDWKAFRAYFKIGFHIHGQLNHKDVSKRTTNFWDFTPYCINKKVGIKINEFCKMVPYNDWIIIRDPDTLYPNPYYGKLIERVISENKDVDLFGCYTNRLGLDYQLVYPQMTNNFDMSYHTTVAEMLNTKHGAEVQEWHLNIAGFFMMFNKQVWEDVKFIETITDDEGYLDWHFSSDVLKHGGKVAMIKGLYVYHNYRLLHGQNAPFETQHIK